MTSSLVYWPNVTSPRIQVIKRDTTKYPFNLNIEDNIVTALNGNEDDDNDN